MPGTSRLTPPHRPAIVALTVTPRQLEARTIDIVDRVIANQPNEDDLVELKSEWPAGIYEAARQLAGHANAAHGERILWIIGVHDKSRRVTGADAQEMSQWYAQIKGHHDAGMAPELVTYLNVPYGENMLAAMLFDTQRAPYVVKNPEYGKQKGVFISLEVPWRQGTAVRSARREDLLRMLAPMELLPGCKVLDIARVNSLQHGRQLDFHLEFTLYLTPRSDRRVVIPIHDCEGEIRFANTVIQLSVDKMRSVASSFTKEDSSRRPLIFEEPNTLVFEGPGAFHVYATALRSTKDITDSHVGIVLTMLPAGSSVPIKITEVMTRSKAGLGEFAWTPKVGSP